MANMSYCRFENTTMDLIDCQEALSELNSLNELSDSEQRAAKRLYKRCIDIVEGFEGLFEEN